MNHGRSLLLAWWVALLGLGADVQALSAQEPPGATAPIAYTRTEYFIPMRDGVRLDTIVYAPMDTRTEYPILLTRTPYDISHPPDAELAREGYIFAFQSVRGRYASGGYFTLMTPQVASHAGPLDVDASTDSFDTIEWLVRHVPGNSHRAGLIGTSYPGFYAAAGMIDAPPELEVVSPQAPQADWFLGDDIHHHGAFLLDGSFGFLVDCLDGAAPPSIATQCTGSYGFDYGNPDRYEFFLSHEPLNRLTTFLRGRIPAWNQLMDHGTYDPYWQARDILPHLRAVRPAILDVGGWYDASDFYGTLHVSESLERQSPNTAVTLVIGPWYHAQWLWPPEQQSAADPNAVAWPAVDYYQKHVLSPFLAHYLKDAPDPDLPRALVFDTGLSVWKRFAHWPPAQVEERRLYLHGAGRLSFAAPASSESPDFDQYVSDPRTPVPYTPALGTGLDDEYQVRDQRFLGRRPDVLAYETEPLASDLTIAGPIDVHLFASTSGTDSDWVIRLIDVSPETAPVYLSNASQMLLAADRSGRAGFQLLVRGDVIRGKFRHSLVHPEPIVPGKVTPLNRRMDDVFHTFRRGHRIMVQIQSTWFPLVDLNPQRFVDIYRASASDFRPASERIYHLERYPSALTLRVLP